MAIRPRRRDRVSGGLASPPGFEARLERGLAPAVVAWLAAVLIGAATLWADPGAGAADDTHTIAIRGIVRALRQATISTEQALLAVEVPFREGDRFQRGDVLVAFDCRRQTAEADAARAQHREAALMLESSRHLERHAAVGRNDVAVAGARADRTRAEVANLEARLDECRLLAPYNGRIVELTVRKHERTQPQRPYLTILDDSELEIETIVPSDMLQVLRPGVRFQFQVDELGGRTVEADVVTVAAAVDPVSKTVKVIGRIARPVDGLLAGMSGTVTFAGG